MQSLYDKTRLVISYFIYFTIYLTGSSAIRHNAAEFNEFVLQNHCFLFIVSYCTMLVGRG